MTMIHIAGQILWYSFLGLMCLGGFFEFREHQEKLKRHSPNIGRRAASLAKRERQYHHHVAKTAPAIAAPIAAKPRSESSDTKERCPAIEKAGSPRETRLAWQGQPMRFQFNDGGREAAGYKGKTGDCVVRSVTIATGIPYQRVYDVVNQLSERERTGTRKRGTSNARTGVYKVTLRRLMESLGWRWTPTMQIGSGCTVHLRANELPSGRLVVSVSKHVTAVIDGVIHDTHDPSRRGTGCVYGYWRRI